MAEHYDLVVVGSGPAGAQGAAQAAALGKQVALVEREPYLGGAGLSTGTMPSKLLREAAHTLVGLRRRALPGVSVALEPELRLADLMYHQDVVIEAAWGSIQRHLERYNIRVAHGTAAFKDAHTLLVRRETEQGQEVTELTGEVFLLATGARPKRPALYPFDHPRVHDANTILGLDHLPRSLAVVGGGIIGCEYASMFNALGAEVTLVEARERLLAFVDDELAARWQRHLEQRGVQFALGADVTSLEPGESSVQLRLTTGLALAVEVVLVAVGRTGNVEGLNLPAAGIEPAPGGLVPVNEYFQTAAPHIYAAGDVLGFPALASTAMEQARLAILRAFAPGTAAPLGSAYPLAVYTVPELAMAGLTEEACQQQHLDYAAGRAEFEHNARAQITGDTSGLLKLLFARGDRRLLGVHVMGDQASELVHLGALALASGGTLDSFANAVYNYPTLSETYHAAARDGLERLARQVPTD
ncbi:MAG: Si-specific NAD(P)(+) transhydrogenase [Anaerolineales bacterium]|nr:Si-specific NAD(P)(+) transhydrogenase [Anaerolineales bacterium]